MLMDSFGRKITYLRISVTDRCNFRCVYCMPAEGIHLQTHASIMRYEEIARVVALAAKEGIREVRITGGEPLVRPDLPELVKMISKIPEIEDISLTTNAVLLEKFAKPLADAGLHRVNVSLDTLRSDRFARISRGGSFEKSWRGILAAEAVGLKPIKLNVVAMRGVNDDELVDMARLCVEHDWHIRFIELMPVKNGTPWGEGFPPPDQIYLSVQEMLEILKPLALEPTSSEVGSGPAREYRINGGKGSIGFITPLGDQFCQSCNRLRLTADGHLRPCLLSDIEIPLLPALRNGDSLLSLIQQAVTQKPLGHELSQHHGPNGRCMMQIGG